MKARPWRAFLFFQRVRAECALQKPLRQVSVRLRGSAGQQLREDAALEPSELPTAMPQWQLVFSTGPSALAVDDVDAADWAAPASIALSAEPGCRDEPVALIQRQWSLQI